MRRDRARRFERRGVPAIAVVLGRATGGAAQPVSSQVIVGGRTASDLQPLLAAAGASGFRLCGVVLDGERPTSALVAVAVQRADPANATWQYGVEVLTNYKSSLSRLNAAARDGFLPVAAEATDSSRVVAMRTWMVVTERPASGRSPSEIAVRSSSGAEGLQRAFNEQGRFGFHADLVWKEGNNRGYAPVAAWIRQGSGGRLVLTNVITKR